jgi:hypothetical protein
MKKLILFGALACVLTSFTSCMKEYTCDCPAGSTATVKTVSKADAKEECETITNGRCTL